MAQKKTARFVEVRARLRFHEDLDTGLYELISSTPESLRGELLHALLTRAAPSMGLPTKIPSSKPFQAPPLQVAAASPQVAATPEPKRSAPAPTSSAPVEEKEHSTATPEQPYVGLEVLGIRTQADWDDAFDYSKPPS